MSLTLLYRKNPTTIDSVVLDASVTQSHVTEVEVTEHPVETGAAISDHARKKPDTLSIEGIVSNTPMSRSQDHRIIATQSGNLSTNVLEDHPADRPGYAEDAYAKLLALADSGKLITIVTSLRTYDSMVLTNLTVPRDAKTGDVLRFTANFKRVRVVTNKTTVVKVAKVPRAKGKQKTGKQVAKPASDAATTDNSIAMDLFGDTFKEKGWID
jgi:hypothetical protein